MNRPLRQILTVVHLGLVVMIAGLRMPDVWGDLKGTLLYTRLTDGTWQIWQTDLATGERAQLTFGPGDKRRPAWTSDGQVMFCTSNQACFQLHVGEPQGAPLFSDLWPLRDVAWSPDGRALAFSRFRTDVVDSANLWLADTTQSRRRMLTHEPGIQEHPAWSPDGQWLAYAAGQGPGTYEIYLVDVAGTQRRQLTTNHANDFLPAWSPDGQWIAFSSDVSGDPEIWVVRADGTQLKPLTHSPGLDTRPAWSPDGATIAFATNRSGALDIWVMNADGTDPQPLERGEAGACDPAWR